VTRYSESMRDLMEASQATGFAMFHCCSCGHRFYPPQSFCPACLAPDVEARSSNGDATVLSTTLIHRSLDRSVPGHRPTHVACVETAEGPSIFAMADLAFAVGSRVRIRLRDGLFHASERTL